MKTLRCQFSISYQYIALLVGQLDEILSNLEAQRKAIVVTIAALYQACCTFFKLKRSVEAASLDENPKMSQEKNLMYTARQSHARNGWSFTVICKQTVSRIIKSTCFY